MPGKGPDLGQAAIRLHEIDGRLGDARVKAGLKRLDVPCEDGRGGRWVSVERA